MILELKYTSNNRYNCTLLNHKIIGQLNHQRHKGKRYIYYRAGLLDDLLFVKVNRGHFLIKIDDEDILTASRIYKIVEDLEPLGEITIREVTIKGVPDEAFITGEQHWKKHSEKWGKKVVWKTRNLSCLKKTE